MSRDIRPSSLLFSFSDASQMCLHWPNPNLLVYKIKLILSLWQESPNLSKTYGRANYQTVKLLGKHWLLLMTYYPLSVRCSVLQNRKQGNWILRTDLEEILQTQSQNTWCVFSVLKIYTLFLQLQILFFSILLFLIWRCIYFMYVLFEKKDF